MIGRYLDLSTSHLTKDEIDNAVEAFAGSNPGPRAIDHTYGLWINVQHEDDGENEAAAKAAGFPNVAAVLAYARSLGDDVNWVNFDADGDVIEELPTFVW